MCWYTKYQNMAFYNLCVNIKKIFLSQYIEEVIGKSLNYIRDKEKDDDDKLLKQIEVCNNLINILANESNEEEVKKYKIDESGELLTFFTDELSVL